MATCVGSKDKAETIEEITEASLNALANDFGGTRHPRGLAGTSARDLTEMATTLAQNGARSRQKRVTILNGDPGRTHDLNVFCTYTEGRMDFYQAPRTLLRYRSDGQENDKGEESDGYSTIPSCTIAPTTLKNLIRMAVS